MKRRLHIVVIIFVAAIAAQSGWANCTWTTPPPLMNFGTYSAFSTTGISVNTQYAIRCTPNDSATVTFDVGSHASSFLPRYMAYSGNQLPYNIFDDAAHTLVMGNGTGGTTKREVFNGTPQNKDFTDTIYGYIAPGLDVIPNAAGTFYNDFVTVTMTSGGTSSSRTFELRVHVQPECTVATFGIAFGNYSPLGTHATTPLDGSTSVDVRCTRGTNVTSVTMNSGNWSANGTRRMQSASGAFLSYNIYRDSARTTVWNTTNVKTGVSTSRNSAVPLLPDGSTAYGRVFPDQDVPEGTYTDTVQATVNY